jgi:hypothetical protein
MDLTVKHEGHRETEKVVVDLSEAGFRLASVIIDKGEIEIVIDQGKESKIVITDIGQKNLGINLKSALRDKVRFF